MPDSVAVPVQCVLQLSTCEGLTGLGFLLGEGLKKIVEFRALIFSQKKMGLKFLSAPKREELETPGPGWNSGIRARIQKKKKS